MLAHDPASLSEYLREENGLRLWGDQLAARKVPGRNGMTWEEEDWVDEEATSSRGPDE